MSIVNDVRVVNEMEPQLKRQLHSVLRLEGKKFKSLFLKDLEELMEHQTFSFEDKQTAEVAIQ